MCVCCQNYADISNAKTEILFKSNLCLEEYLTCFFWRLMLFLIFSGHHLVVHPLRRLTKVTGK